MKLEKVTQEFAKDYIELVNSLKGMKYNSHVNYTTKTGQKIKFDYLTLDKIYDEVKKNNNFAIVEPLGTDEMGASALQVMMVHKSGEAIISDYYQLRVPNNGSKQDEGSAITYTKRYALGSFLGICTDVDNDANPGEEGMPIEDKPRLITEGQMKVLSDVYKEENLIKLLEANGIETLEQMTLTKASEIIGKLKVKKPVSDSLNKAMEDTYNKASNGGIE